MPPADPARLARRALFLRWLDQRETASSSLHLSRYTHYLHCRKMDDGIGQNADWNPRLEPARDWPAA
jgi:hypothetical protein